ncbi:MAG: RNA polymerase sigma factor [Planctomycetota bacterium]
MTDSLRHADSPVPGRQPPVDDLVRRLWAEYRRRVFVVTYAVLADYDEAEDATAAVFLKVVDWYRRHGGTLPANANVPAWMDSIARNHARDRLRRRRTERSVTVVLHGADDDGDDPPRDPLDRFADAAAATPDELAWTQEELEQLRRCLKMLPEGLRVIVVLCDVDGVQQKDVADRLKVSPSTVTRQRQSAHQTLRRCVETGGINTEGSHGT